MYYNIYPNLTVISKLTYKTEVWAYNRKYKQNSAHAKKQRNLLMSQQVSSVPFAPCRWQLWDGHHGPVTYKLLYWSKQFKK